MHGNPAGPRIPRIHASLPRRFRSQPVRKTARHAAFVLRPPPSAFSSPCCSPAFSCLVSARRRRSLPAWPPFFSPLPRPRSKPARACRNHRADVCRVSRHARPLTSESKPSPQKSCPLPKTQAPYTNTSAGASAASLRSPPARSPAWPPPGQSGPPSPPRV